MRSLLPIVAGACVLNGGWGCGAEPVAECPADFASSAEPDPDFASSPASVRVGSYTYDTVHEQRIAASFRTEPLPSLHQVATEEGNCRQLTAGIYRCDPWCEADQLCTAENTCTTVGLAKDAGTLTISIDGVERTLESDSLASYRATEEAPTTASCGAVTAAAVGGEFPAFVASAALVPPLEVVNSEELGYFRGEPLTIRWVPADPHARMRVTLRADSAMHGPAYPSIIECDLADDAGEVTVSAAMIDTHLDQFGCGMCPSASVTRYRRVTANAGDAEVELVTYAEQNYFLYPGGVGLFSASDAPSRWR